MPSISMFYGVIIYMYIKDNQQHKLPHIHAKYAGEFTVFDLNTGNVLEGNMPYKQAHFVKSWILLHQEELLANWELAIKGEKLYNVEPLK